MRFRKQAEVLAGPHALPLFHRTTSNPVAACSSRPSRSGSFSAQRVLLSTSSESKISVMSLCGRRVWCCEPR